jgi:predicted DNA-binding protein (MmcQ/YjbR family)
VDVAAMQAHCLAKPGAWPDNPWGHDHPVIKVGEGSAAKIEARFARLAPRSSATLGLVPRPALPPRFVAFAFLGSGGVGVKGGASREAADEWLLRYPGAASVMAYIGRSGWNDLAFGDEIPDDELLEAVDESYRLVVAKLPKKHRPDGWDA